MPFGATSVPEGARFRLWAPAARSVDLGLGADAHALTWHALAGEADSWYHGIARRCWHTIRLSHRRRETRARSRVTLLHVGTLTQEGTFAGVAARLDYLVDLGITVLELLPLADFSGRRNWGYDGALPFAPDATYGHPEDLKALVAPAHRRGLMVILDVV